jgi:hypothetical protein
VVQQGDARFNALFMCSDFTSLLTRCFCIALAIFCISFSFGCGTTTDGVGGDRSVVLSRIEDTEVAAAALLATTVSVSGDRRDELLLTNTALGALLFAVTAFWYARRTAICFAVSPLSFRVNFLVRIASRIEAPWHQILNATAFAMRLSSCPTFPDMLGKISVQWYSMIS